MSAEFDYEIRMTGKGVFRRPVVIDKHGNQLVGVISLQEVGFNGDGKPITQLRFDAKFVNHMLIEDV